MSNFDNKNKLLQLLESISPGELLELLNKSEFAEDFKLVLMVFAGVKFILQDGWANVLSPGPLKSLTVRRKEFAAKYGLSKLEVDTVCLVAEGKTSRQIAMDLPEAVSVHTVIGRLRNIFVKTGTSNRTELAVLAAKEGLI